MHSRRWYSHYDQSTQNIKISITGETNEDCFVSVYHLSGAKLITQSMSKGTMETSINMTFWSNGWYIVLQMKREREETGW